MRRTDFDGAKPANRHRKLTNYVNYGKEGYSGRWCPGVVSVVRRITGMQQGIRAGDTAYRRIREVVHAKAIDGIDSRQSLDMTGNTGAVYAFFVVVVVMGRRREHE